MSEHLLTEVGTRLPNLVASARHRQEMYKLPAQILLKLLKYVNSNGLKIDPTSWRYFLYGICLLESVAAMPLDDAVRLRKRLSATPDYQWLFIARWLKHQDSVSFTSFQQIVKETVPLHSALRILRLAVCTFINCISIMFY